MAGKSFDLAGKRIYVAGHGGMVGSAIVRRLTGAPCELIIADRDKVDLERQAQAEDFLAATKPDVVIVAAARVGGARQGTGRCSGRGIGGHVGRRVGDDQLRRERQVAPAPPALHGLVADLFSAVWASLHAPN